MSQPTFEDVLSAAARPKPVKHTPWFKSDAMNAITGATVFLKNETEQLTGSFKFRGAYNALSRLSSEQKKRGVVAYSSGNHAQALALAGRYVEVPITIVMPTDAPKIKIGATRDHGAKIVFYDRTTESREQIAADLAQNHGFALIPPFDHPDIIAGQGTAALELIRDVGPLDRLFVCLGGGGLISGSALVAKALSPGCEIYGVEPMAGNDVQQSFRIGRIIEIATPDTIADGAQTRRVGDLTFPIIQRDVTDILTVTDDQLRDQMHFFWTQNGLRVEPTGCLAAAAVQNRLIDNRSLKIGVIISGGNVDTDRFNACISRQPRWQPVSP